MAEEVEGGAFRSEDRRQRSAHRAQHRAGGHRSALLDCPHEFDRRVDLHERFCGASGAGDNAGRSHDKLGNTSRTGRQHRGGQVAQRIKVLLQRAIHCAAYRMKWWVQVAVRRQRR